jgi:hypothetical protein
MVLRTIPPQSAAFLYPSSLTRTVSCVGHAPECKREFKWLISQDSEKMEPEGYHCPYCNSQANPNAWFT